MDHSFNVQVAEIAGVKEAVILHNLYYWCNHNRKNNLNYYEGYYWTYNSIKAFEEMFPYMTGNQINYALKHLEELGLIITGCFNDNKYDHTKWYALTEKAYSILENSQINLEKNQNQIEKNPESFKQILNTNDKQDSKPNIKQSDDCVEETKPKENITKSLFNVYLQTYQELYQTEPNYTPSKNATYARWNKHIMGLIKKGYSLEQLHNTILLAKNDDFARSIGFDLQSITSEKMIAKYANSGVRKNKQQVKQDSFDWDKE